jgi:hypothetical protein
MKVGQLSKTLRVLGDRYWQNGLIGLKMTDPEPFVKMPIVYERAFGGVDQKSGDAEKHDWERRNPIGAGFAVASAHLDGQMLPNVEEPRELISSWKQRPPPVSGRLHETGRHAWVGRHV